MSDPFVEDFRQPILSIISYLGGKARMEQVCEEFALRFPSVAKNAYWNETSNGDLRWRDYLNRCRLQILIPEGILRSDTESWEIDTL